MAHCNLFEDLKINKVATLFCHDIWTIIQNTSLQKDYKLREQINGSSSWIMDTSAEGFGRGGNK